MSDRDPVAEMIAANQASAALITRWLKRAAETNHLAARAIGRGWTGAPVQARDDEARLISAVRHVTAACQARGDQGCTYIRISDILTMISRDLLPEITEDE